MYPALPHWIMMEQARINTSWDQKETATYKGDSPYSFMFKLFAMHSSMGIHAYMIKVRGHNTLLIFNFFSEGSHGKSVGNPHQM